MIIFLILKVKYNYGTRAVLLHCPTCIALYSLTAARTTSSCHERLKDLPTHFIKNVFRLVTQTAAPDRLSSGINRSWFLLRRRLSGGATSVKHNLQSNRNHRNSVQIIETRHISIIQAVRQRVPV